MLRRIHPLAGGLGFLTLLTFWTLTMASELSGSLEAIVAVKKTIPWGFFVLVPALIVTGASGFRLGAGVSNPVVTRKRWRSPLIAAIGILVLSPAAAYLAKLASWGQFDGGFYAVQAIELVADGVNLALMSLNIRDGLRLSGRLSRPRPAE